MEGISLIPKDSGYFFVGVQPELIDSNPELSAAILLFNAGVAACEAGSLPDAAGYFAAALSLSPRLAWAHNNYGVVRNLLGDHEGAIECYDLAIESDCNLACAYFNRGLCKTRSPNIEDAVKDIREAIRRGLFS
ncbi:MAG: tetratricopeptide repeat protein [Candidatus Berkelbacteria bacterium]|nr:tetratricopeptide repeat protein [Candidatus Berkelbacteria bacterium]